MEGPTGFIRIFKIIAIMTRFWFEFDLRNMRYYHQSLMARGCGVTAFSKFQALQLLQEKVFLGSEIPPILNCIENVDVSALDNNHVLPNMGIPVNFGIWYPLGYQEY